ncbi:MAG: serine/threonine-protein kinase [Pseudomonadota bacterium]|nr:serine/threonine-protein kinase [Pseudomonadota bacterium]
MNDLAERRRRVSALFDAALDLPASQRAALLADACADDPALRAEVERLLAADATLDLAACIDRDAAATAGDVTDTVATATERQLGAWQLTTLLGRGGMGEVFAAHRVDDPRHRAAIKYVRRRWDGSVESQRFAEERRILARLSHPAIPSLIDHGVDEEGRPWFALDYVDGKDLLSHADSRQLGLGQRIDLFRAVCSAVQHAHQHFVVHRDLKPGNILVDQDGHPKVLDFGVAKRLDQDASQTRTGNIAGFTPAYAAPE